MSNATETDVLNRMKEMAVRCTPLPVNHLRSKDVMDQNKGAEFEKQAPLQ